MPPQISKSCSGSGSGCASQKRIVDRAVVIHKPEAGSLRHLLVTNPSKRWYLPPELWTSEIVQQLECVFQPLSGTSSNGRCSKNTFSGSAGPPITYESFTSSPKNDPAATSLWKVGLTKQLHLKDRAIRCFFADLVRLLDRSGRYAVDINCSKLPLFFGEKPVASVYCPLLVRENKTSRLVCAFIDRTWVIDDGEAYFPARRFKEKFARSSAASSAHVQPIDPYFIAIIIAMAQVSAQASTQVTQSSRLISLFTPSADRKCLILRTAEVNPAFLNKFAHPYKRSDSSLLISEESIPIKSPARILEAMTRILEQGGQGEADRQQKTSSGQLNDNIKHTDGRSSLGRKRQPLSDCSNFSESTNGASPQPKRQRSCGVN